MKNQNTLSVITAVFLCLSFSVHAQTLFVPSGAGGIGTSPSNVGVGTANPSSYLAGTNGLTLFGTNPGLALSTSSKTWLLWGKASDNSFRIYENGAGLDRLTILPGGNIGIGATNPSYALDIVKNDGISTINQRIWNSNTSWAAEALIRGYTDGYSSSYPAVDFGFFRGISSNETSGFIVKTGTVASTSTKFIINQAGSVGINTTTPSALLHVKNGNILFEGTGLDAPTTISGTGRRMMWIPAKAAFRAGNVDGTQWDDANIGYYSVAMGQSTKASGQNSFAAGNNTNALAIYSTAFGSGTTASGSISIAFGAGTTASGDNSTVFGSGTVAQSYRSFVLGAFNHNPGTYNPSTWVASEPLFVLGNGTSAGATSNAVTVLKNGNTGLGTPTPVAKLDVNGNGYFSGPVAIGTESLPNVPTRFPTGYQLAINGNVIAVEYVAQIASTWPDYVFKKDYKLKKLDDLENFIKEKEHLPGIPSAKEVEKDGVSLANMVTKQMEKIEELTLYMIQMNKEIQALKAENEKLKISNK